MDNILSLLDGARNFFTGTLSGISSVMSIDLAIKLVLGYFFIIWGAFIIWVTKDITNRTANIFVQTVSIFIILFFTPLFGLPIYLLIRPRRTIFEQYYEEEELEESADELEEVYHCPGCNHKVSRDFRFCPKCALELTVSCPSCNEKVHTDWTLCPYCGEKNILPEKTDTQKPLPKDKNDTLVKEKEASKQEPVTATAE